MIYFELCPNCQHNKYSAVNLNDGTPVTGFLNKFSEYYFKCEKCSLVFLNPTLPDDELYVYYDEFSYEKLSNIKSFNAHFNNLGRETVSTFYNYLSVSSEVDKLKKNSEVLDLGGGGGDYCAYLRNNYPSFKISLFDYRINEYVKKELNKRKIEAKNHDFLNEDIMENKYDLISTWEVVEHIPIPKLKSFFNKIRKALRPDGIYVLSTPDISNVYTQALGFWAAYPGEHLSVFQENH